MNFFEQQDQARQKTWLLIVLFSVAVLFIIGLTVALVTVSIWGFDTWTNTALDSRLHSPNVSLILKTAFFVLVIIACVVLFKRLQISQGGRYVAESLGGKPIEQGTTNTNEQQLLNIVEEMAIAAGLPVPPVYLLPETSINAFAAGFNDNDAVIGVTRGTLERLSRDQLQGVVAHEFSHILHGDMRLNLNLITILSGIIFISQSGKFLLYTTSRSRSRNKGVAPILGLGLGLVVIGSIGTLFGSLIKAAVSRQREFLADASAVQYTRNPTGIANALKVIAGSSAGSSLSSPSASECSHLFFGDAIFARAFGFLSTHPPLDIRIQRIEPNWDGNYLPGKPLAPEEPVKTTSDYKNKMESLAETLRNTGFLDPIMVGIAHALMDSLPDPLYDATHNPGSAYALMLALRLDTDISIQNKQLAYISDMPAMEADVKRYAALKHLVAERDILPIIEMCIPALKRLSANQYKQLKQHITQFIMCDQTSDIKEWLHFRLLSYYLDTHFNPSRTKRFKRSFHSFAPLRDELNCTLSFLANEGNSNDDARDKAFNKAKALLNHQGLQRIDSEALNLQDINKSLDKLNYLVPLLKEDYLSACAECIQADSQVTPTEWDLLRVIAACIGCPMPIVNRPQ